MDVEYQLTVTNVRLGGPGGSLDRSLSDTSIEFSRVRSAAKPSRKSGISRCNAVQLRRLIDANNFQQ